MSIGGPCTRCGATHDHDRVRVGAPVMVVGEDRAAGAIGSVYSWTLYGTPLTVRVQFPQGVLDPREPGIVRDNFYPCELVYVAPRREAAP